MKLRKTISIFCCAALVISLAACGSKTAAENSAAATAAATAEVTETSTAAEVTAAAVPSAAEPTAEEETAAEEGTELSAAETASMKPWTNGMLKGTVTAETETDPKKDFYIAANKNYILNAKIHPGYSYASAFSDIDHEFSQRVGSMMERFDSTDHDCIQAYNLYQLVLDMDRRNKAGIEPNITYIEEIRSIGTLEELTGYLTEKDFMNSLFSYFVLTDMKDSKNNAVYIDSSALMLEDADEYAELTDSGKIKKEAFQELLSKLLPMYGFTEEETQNVIDLSWDFETRLAASTIGRSEAMQDDYRERIYNPVTAEELFNRCSAFPVAKLLEHLTAKGTDRFILLEPEWLAKLDSLYTQENVEAIKAYLLQTELLYTVSLLDQTCLDLSDAASSKICGMEYHTDLSVDAYDVVNGWLPMALSKLYVETYVSEEMKPRITKLCYEALEAYKRILTRNDWLREETKNKALEKIETMKVRAAYPDDWSKYRLDGLDITGPENGGNYLMEILKANDFLREDMLRKKLGKPVDPDEWPMSPATVNACYSQTDNSINITTGILNGAFYNDDMSDAQILGSIGTIIGHEISHALDSAGSQYDAQGNLVNWWTEEDRKNFNERVDRIVAYYDTIDTLPGKKIDGQLTRTENTADICGLRCAMEMAAQLENCNYDELFKAYAGAWAAVMSYELLDNRRVSDVHSPAFARTNAVLQQIDEFYETYEIKEGDTMYLAPENRLKVW